MQTQIDSSPRLLRSRRYTHGLSQAPPLKVPEVRGNKACLPCPRAQEGTCAYARVYGCNPGIRSASQAFGGVCLIERLDLAQAVQDALGALLYKPGETPGAEVQQAATVAAEADIYYRRAISYLLLLQTGEAQGLTLDQACRYLEAASNALLRREADMVVARLRDLGQDVEEVRKECQGKFWAWWRVNRRHLMRRTAG